MVKTDRPHKRVKLDNTMKGTVERFRI